IDAERPERHVDDQERKVEIERQGALEKEAEDDRRNGAIGGQDDRHRAPWQELWLIEEVAVVEEDADGEEDRADDAEQRDLERGEADVAFEFLAVDVIGLDGDDGRAPPCGAEQTGGSRRLCGLHFELLSCWVVWLWRSSSAQQ